MRILEMRRSLSRESMSTTTRSNHRRRSESRRTSKSLQLPSSLPSDIRRIVDHILIVFCRRFIFASAQWKIFFYFSLILFGPFLRDIQLVPQTVSFAMKIDRFYRIISQLGWMCSIVFLLPFVYLTSLIYARGHYGLIFRHLMRLIIGTIIWYSLRTLFRHIEIFTGHHHRRASRFSWQEGQTFLYLYALLVINEEVKFYDENWLKIHDLSLSHFATNEQFSLTLNQNRLKIFSAPIRILFYFLAILTMLWESMILCSAVYFHHILQKLFAAIVSVFFWFVTYRFCFRINFNSDLAPCSPGDGFITF